MCFSRFFSGLLMLLPFFALAACDQAAVHGSGNYVTQTHNIIDFTSLRVETTGEIHITIGESPTLSVAAYENILPLLTFSVEDGVLVLNQAEGTGYVTDQPIAMTITVPTLESIEVAGTANIAIDNLSGDMFTADIRSPGNLTTHGSVTEQTVTVSGTGHYYGFGLQTVTTAITISGAGEAQITASDTLIATLSGEGGVIYQGEPDVTEYITGTGHIQPAPTPEQ
ncbi:DUF2807 domain-containing protein [Phototrophicus methaneseepsis]|uniref:DUF2807 domain-containing protein n=1 Tax=Phototrophicus methaneseepsis TaxID=2710758 RepID=A0A7S8E8H7_9CHLR|nr:DUF2807 domain-containing protein [Phototrophicus methaneseepsis]QPC82311.1 DUF2807 domain-containing protein [Phototrophicus methaneseepsis]